MSFFSLAMSVAVVAAATSAEPITRAAPACDNGMVSSISFRPLTEDDLPTVVGWFAEPEIACWWSEPAHMASVRAKYLPRIGGLEPTSMWVAEFDETAAGLFQCYQHADYPDHDAAVGIPAAVGIDYLIGDSYRGRGLGRQMLAVFAALALDLHPTTTVCVATPAQGNVASWRALEHAGFTRHGECQPPDEPIAYVYTLLRAAANRTCSDAT